MMVGGIGSWDSYNKQKENKILVRKSINDKNIWMDKDDERVISGEYKHFNSFVVRETYKRKENKIHGKEIHIFDETGKIVHICKKNFSKICEEYNLPKKSLVNSYTNEGIKIFQTKRQLKACKKFGYEKYIGWSAKIIANHIM